MSPLDTCLIQGSKQPTANKDDPWSCEAYPLIWSLYELRWRGGLAQFWITCSWNVYILALWGFSDTIKTLSHIGAMLRVIFFQKEVISTKFLTQHQTKSIDKKIPGLMFLFYKTACPQTQNVANSSSQNQHIYFWAVRTGHNRILFKKKKNQKNSGERVCKNFTCKYSQRTYSNLQQWKQNK